MTTPRSIPRMLASLPWLAAGSLMTAIGHAVYGRNYRGERDE